MYHVGDYVYVEPAEPNLQPHIIYIERLWQDDTGEAQFCFNETKSILICESYILSARVLFQTVTCTFSLLFY